eukprot:TRINITY_DN113882_c0_g1_i1.p1 TRINITY_DN113882_c0_g1~~TRINITY_DN113882_c0_g1_i1.p1  ORF type:complete len:100 (+),score=4.95 TRINITY_DN113882_c0_g1_i1:40-300(+)
MSVQCSHCNQSLVSRSAWLNGTSMSPGETNIVNRIAFVSQRASSEDKKQGSQECDAVLNMLQEFGQGMGLMARLTSNVVFVRGRSL